MQIKKSKIVSLAIALFMMLLPRVTSRRGPAAGEKQAEWIFVAKECSYPRHAGSSLSRHSGKAWST